MARKIDLQDLFNRNQLSVDLKSKLSAYTAIEDAGSNGISSMFDGDENTELRLNNTVSAPEGAPQEWVNLNFSHPIQAKTIRITSTTSITQTYNIYINYGRTDNHPQQSSGLITKTGNGTYETENTNFDLSSFGKIYSINFELKESNSSNDHFIAEVELYVLEEWEDKYFEFNDSVLETQAWNSSRYTGKQLQASTINEYNSGDSSYKNTPVVSNYTRTFYLTSDIISLSPNSNNEFEDSTLPYIEDFSFVVVNQAITINEDDSITLIDLSTINSNQLSKITGFQRYFQNNIPIKSEIGLIPLDAAVPNNTDNSYTVYFNEGRLRKIADFTHATHTTVGDDVLGFGYNPNSDPPSFTPLSGSAPVTDPINGRAILIDTKYARQILGPGFTGDDFNKNYNNGGVAWTALFNSMVTESLVNPSTSKYFISFSTSASFSSSYYPTEKALKVINYESDQYGTTNTLAGLSTILLAGQAGKSLYDDYSVNTNKNYFSPIRYAQYSDGAGGDNLPDDQTVIGYSISKLDNSKPCLLINLSKNELPGGSGNKSTVIIPETLHPYVKDNLIFFLSKAGIDIGSREAIPALNKTNVNLP